VGENPVVGVPLVRILDRVRIHVPAIVVPVHVHSAKRRYCTKNRLLHRPSAIAPGLNLIRDLKVRQFSIPILVFFEESFSALAPGVPGRDSETKNSEAMAQ